MQIELLPPLVKEGHKKNRSPSADDTDTVHIARDTNDFE